MIDVQTIAAKLESELNAMGGLTFKIFSNAGEYKAENSTYARRHDETVYGILSTVPGSTIVPVQGLNSYSTAFELQLAASYNVKDELNNFLTLYVQQNVGASSRLDDYAAVVSFDLPTVGQVEQVTPFGRCIPVLLPIYYQFIQNGVLSNDVKIAINGENLMALSATFTRGRAADTNWLMGSEEMQSAIGQQGITVSLTLAYTEGGVVEKLVSDILAGKLIQAYSLTYNDGNTSFERLVVMQDGSVNMEAQKVASVSVSFLLAREDIYGGI